MKFKDASMHGSKVTGGIKKCDAWTDSQKQYARWGALNEESKYCKYCKPAKPTYFVLFVLRFYGPVNS